MDVVGDIGATWLWLLDVLLMLDLKFCNGPPIELPIKIILFSGSPTELLRLLSDAGKERHHYQ